MDRRGFLKTIAAGAVAGVLPLPSPAELVTITGNVTAYFSSNALYDRVFVRFCEETVFGEHPTGMTWKMLGRDQQP